MFFHVWLTNFKGDPKMKISSNVFNFGEWIYQLKIRMDHKDLFVYLLYIGNIDLTNESSFLWPVCQPWLCLTGFLDLKQAQSMEVVFCLLPGSLWHSNRSSFNFQRWPTTVRSWYKLFIHHFWLDITECCHRGCI